MLISWRGGISALSAVRPHADCRYRFGHRKACKKVFVRIQTIRAVGCEFGRRQDYRLRLFLSVMRTISPPSAFVRMISEPAGTVFTPYTSTLDFEFDAGISSISLDDATNTLPPSIRIPPSASSPVSAPVVLYTISVPPVT